MSTYLRWKAAEHLDKVFFSFLHPFPIYFNSKTHRLYLERSRIKLFIYYVTELAIILGFGVVCSFIPLLRELLSSEKHLSILQIFSLISVVLVSLFCLVFHIGMYFFKSDIVTFTNASCLLEIEFHAGKSCLNRMV